MKKKGFTLIEILIVVAIIGILLIVSMKNTIHQKSKAEDARIKRDLETLRVAFEEYYNDNNCYPPTEWFDGPEDCNADYLQPYLNSIPCNKKTNQPYHLVTDSASCAKSYWLYANLQNSYDKEAEKLWVFDGSGEDGYNYGISSTNTSAKINPPSDYIDPNATYYYCVGPSNGGGGCTTVTDIGSLPQGCTLYREDPNCGGGCTARCN